MIAQRITRTRPTALSLSSVLSVSIPERKGMLTESFSAALLHEVRNPITNINLAVEMLQGVASNDLQKAYLEIITRASLRINGLINELVRLKQPEHLQFTNYSMPELLDEILLMTADRLMIKNITVTKMYTTRDYTKKGDRAAMKIALTNIIINAIDAMKCEKGHLKLFTHYLGGRYIIQIGDNGCGIKKDNLEHIFQPYFTSKKDGLGIGLAATHDILKANKVDILVQSEQGFGTKFTLSFPRECPVFPVNKVK